MAIDLLKITPYQVSRDLSGYITYIYGPAKVGKTTLASQMPKPLLLAFEVGYHALPGVMAQDITSWSEIKQVLRELKKPEVKEMFSTICIDTVDIAANLCEKYVCSQNGVDTISQIPYGQGWTLLKKEFESTFRAITQLGYAVFFISHCKESTFKRPDGTEYSLIRPSVTSTYNSIIENMTDIYGYMHPVVQDGVTKVKITLRSVDGTISAGGRFKYMAEEIDSDYDSLVKALNDAIDKEAQLTDNKFVTDEKHITVKEELDFDKILEEFNSMVNKLIADSSEEDFVNIWQPRIIEITEKYLGKGKKVNQCTRDQVEMLSLIVFDLKDLIENN
jgi:hypothetical protein